MFFKLFGSPQAMLVTNPTVFADKNGKVHLNLELSFDSVEDVKKFLEANDLPTVEFDRK